MRPLADEIRPQTLDDVAGDVYKRQGEKGAVYP